MTFIDYLKEQKIDQFATDKDELNNDNDPASRGNKVDLEKRKSEKKVERSTKQCSRCGVQLDKHTDGKKVKLVCPKCNGVWRA